MSLSFFGRSQAPPPFSGLSASPSSSSSSTSSSSPSPPILSTSTHSSSDDPSLLSPSPALSPSSGSLSLPHRSYKELFVNNYPQISLQTDEGLRSIKRNAAFFEHTCETQLASAESLLKQIKSVKEKYSDGRDECTHFVHASLVVEEVMEHTGRTIDAFAKAVLNDLVKAMRTWHKEKTAKKMTIDREMNKLSDKLKSNVEEINKERKACALAFAELKQAATLKQSIEQQGGMTTDAYTKHRAKWQKMKDAAIKKFQTFESKLDNCRTAQQNFYRNDVPQRLNELEGLERERLAYQQDCYVKFASIFSVYSRDLSQSNDLMQKVLPTLNINKAMNLLFDKWTTQFGIVSQQLLPVPYDLPCRWTEIQSDVLDSQGGKDAQSLNASVSPVYQQPHIPPTNVSDNPFQSSSSNNNNQVIAQYSPPNPSDDDALNPFSDAAAYASTSNDSDVLFIAEGLFDFDLQSEPDSDIQYVNFKAGDHIKVTQEGDEWWYGEVGGKQGFFAANYTRRLPG